MALMTTLLKSILNGSKSPAPTHGEMKGALATVYDFTTEMLGTDSANKAAARDALGLLDAAGMRNLLYNPGFTVTQRNWNPSFPVNITIAYDGITPPYFTDRWRAGSPTSTYTLTAVGNVNQMTIGASRQMWQHVPGENIVGGTYQLTWEGTATAYVNNVAVARGGTVTLAAGVNAKVAFASGTVLRPQLELGACRSWEARPYAIELMLCRYFFERPTTTQFHYFTANGKTGIRFAVRKRATPTIVVSQGSPNAISVVTNDATATGTTQFVISAVTAGATSFSWAADAEIYE